MRPMMMKMILVAALLAGLAGCAAVVPTVQYREIKRSDDMQGMSDAFYLQASAVVVDVSRTGVAKIASVRKASEYKYGIKPQRSWRSDTIVSLAKIPNTDVVSSIGIDTKDNTVKVLSDYGGAIVKLGGLALGLREADACNYPMTLPIASNSADSRAAEEVSPNPACVSIVLGPVPVDAFARAGIPVDVDTQNYYHAACRDATVTVKTSALATATETVRVADPRFVQLVQFPVKGTVTAHSECGASVVTKDPGSDSSAAVLEALATEAKAIKAAIDSAK